MTHADLKKLCLLAVTAAGGRAWPVETGVARSMDGERIITYGVNGGSDIMGILRGGRFLAIECKIGRNRLSYAQQMFKKMVIDMGGLYVEARSVADVEAALAS